MNPKMTFKPISTTELFFTEFLKGGNEAVFEQISKYKKVADIYERAMYVLGRKVAYRSINSSTEGVKINIHDIRATNKI